MKLLKKEPHENVRQYAYRVLLYNITRLELLPGAVLSENELSSAMGISRTPVREALIELSKMSLVDIIPQRGSYVTKIDYSLIEDARFIRLVIEKSIIREVSEKVTPKHLLLLELNIEEEKEALKNEDHELFMELDNRFHEILYSIAGRERVYSFIKPQLVHFDRLRALTIKTTPRDQTLEDHIQILKALKDKDLALATNSLEQHLTRHKEERQELETMYPEFFITN